jgi:hypothetical protein
MSSLPFDLNGGLRVWGGPWEKMGKFNRLHPDELLPCLFERTLHLDEPPQVGSLDWVFTGERAGLTVSVEQDRVSVVVRHYDSPTLTELGHNDAGGRYPECKSEPVGCPLAAPPRSVSVSIDHRQQLAVHVDGHLVFSRRWLPDLRRHQLQTENENRIRGRIDQPEPVEVTVGFDAGKRHQQMLGFGGTCIPTAYAQLSNEGRGQWWKLIAEYNLLIQREYPNSRRLNESMDNWDDLSLAVPHYYGDSFPNSEITDFEIIRRIRQLGGLILFEFWYPPSTDPVEYARTMVKFCTDCAQKTGAPPEICGVLNEWPHEPVFEQMWDFTLELRRQLDAAGFPDVKIHMPDDSFLGTAVERAEALRARPEVWKAIDFSATHEYDVEPLFDNLDAADELIRNWHRATADKPFLCNELTVLLRENQCRDYRVALCCGQLYHKNLTLADAVMIGYCWTLLNVEQPNFGWTRSLFIPDLANGGLPVASSHQLRVLGAYSRRIRKGMVRIESLCANPDLLVSAFLDDTGKGTLVALNRSIHPMRLRLQDCPFVPTECERVGPYHPNTSNPFESTITVEPGEVLTLSNMPLHQI